MNTANQKNTTASIPPEKDWRDRTGLLIGKERIEKIARAHVFVAGLGGVGGIAAEMLVRAGIGQLTIADGDFFDTTNRNRQLGALVSTTGKQKTSVLAKRFLDINPDLVLNVISEFLQEERMEEVLRIAAFDCVLDAIDSLSPKVTLALCCLSGGIPLVSCMGAGEKLRPELVRCADISETFQCPLARAVRKRLRQHGITTGYRAVFSPEPPSGHACNPAGTEEKSPAASVPGKRRATGSISYMAAVFGCHCAAAVLEKIAGFP